MVVKAKGLCQPLLGYKDFDKAKTDESEQLKLDFCLHRLAVLRFYFVN